MGLSRRLVSCVYSSPQVGNPRVELTLSELQDMAARQQQQIENQQQMLVAKVSQRSGCGDTRFQPSLEVGVHVFMVKTCKWDSEPQLLAQHLCSSLQECVVAS